VHNVENNGEFMLEEVIVVLPAPIQGLLEKGDKNSYNTLTTAVHALNITDFWEAVKKHNCDEETA
jgi:hypothetical protein